MHQFQDFSSYTNSTICCKNNHKICKTSKKEVRSTMNVSCKRFRILIYRFDNEEKLKKIRLRREIDMQTVNQPLARITH